MFRIYAEVGALYVGDASGNVIRLIEGEVVHPGCDRGPTDGSCDHQDQEKEKETRADCEIIPTLCLQWLCQRAHKSSRLSKIGWKPELSGNYSGKRAEFVALIQKR